MMLEFVVPGEIAVGEAGSENTFSKLEIRAICNLLSKTLAGPRGLKVQKCTPDGEIHKRFQD